MGYGMIDVLFATSTTYYWTSSSRITHHHTEEKYKDVFFSLLVHEKVATREQSAVVRRCYR